MSNSIENISNATVSDVFSSYTSLITHTRGNLFEGLGYETVKNDHLYNKAYFSSTEVIDEKNILEKISKAQKIIQNLSTLKGKIDSIEVLNDEQKQVLQGMIQKNIWGLEYDMHVIYIEAEKAGFEQDKSQISFHNQEKLKLEESIYGKRITEIPYRSEHVVKKLNELYAARGNDLSPEQQSFWQQSIVPKLTPFIPSSVSSEPITPSSATNTVPNSEMYISEKAIFPLTNLALQIEGFEREDLLNIQMQKGNNEPYIKNGIYYIPDDRRDEKIEQYFVSQNLEQKFKVIKQLTGNASVNIEKGEGKSFKHNYIKLPPPEKNGKYRLTTWILPILFDHEIATHIMTSRGDYNNYNIRTPNSEDFEEGVALLNQYLTTHTTLDDFYESSIGDICQFLGEICDDPTLKEALQILYILNPSYTLTPETRFRRIRMGVPLGYIGARRKDMTYGAGKDIIKQLEDLSKTEEGREQLKRYIKAKYGSKIAFQDVEHLDQILKGIGSLNEMEVTYPYFIGKILYRKLFKGKITQKSMVESDIRNLIDGPTKMSRKKKRLLIQMLETIRAEVPIPKIKK